MIRTGSTSDQSWADHEAEITFGSAESAGDGLFLTVTDRDAFTKSVDSLLETR